MTLSPFVTTFKEQMTKKMYIPQLAGLSVRLVDGTVVEFTDDEKDDNSGGVREPSRPKTPKDSAHA